MLICPRSLAQLNSSLKTPQDFIETEGLDMVYPGEGPNLLTTPSIGGLPPVRSSTSSSHPAAAPGLARRKSTKSRVEPLELHAARPVYEKNRCTVVLTQGDPENGGGGRRRRRYLVASDLSEESLYAIEVSFRLSRLSCGLGADTYLFPGCSQWAIGTVLRSGDECLLVSVMETDTKFDPENEADNAKMSSSEKRNKITNQRERQANALMLSRQGETHRTGSLKVGLRSLTCVAEPLTATALLERTRLHVTIICQAIHAKVPRVSS